MTVFLRTWDASYESSPPGTQAANQLDTRIQEVKKDVRERIDVEHYLAGDTEDGVHKFVAQNLAARDAIGTPKSGQLIVRSDTRSIDIYNGTKWIEFMAWQAGDMKMAAYDDAAAVGWHKCDGSAISRTVLGVDLFAVIGTEFGVGDGSTTFNVPKMDGRMPIGIDSADTDFDAMGETGGDKAKTIAEANLPSHVHTFDTDTDGAHTHDIEFRDASGGSNGFDRPSRFNVADAPNDATSSTAIASNPSAHAHSGTTDSVGSGTAQDVMNPFIAMQWYIKL